jgi:DNA-binding transcriptional MerR regulator
MRISELSSTSGVPVATIKFYLREGLLPPGALTSANQAEYSTKHVERLRLIRALIDVGGLSVASAGAVLAAIDSDGGLQETFAIAQHVVSAPILRDEVAQEALQRIDDVMPGWRVSPDNPGRLAAGRVLTTFEAVGQHDDRGWFRRYAEAALLVAAADLDEIDTRHDLAAKAETVVVGTVLGDALFSGFRRAAQEHITALRYSALDEGNDEEQS